MLWRCLTRVTSWDWAGGYGSQEWKHLGEGSEIWKRGNDGKFREKPPQTNRAAIQRLWHIRNLSCLKDKGPVICHYLFKTEDMAILHWFSGVLHTKPLGEGDRGKWVALFSPFHPLKCVMSINQWGVTHAKTFSFGKNWINFLGEEWITACLVESVLLII